MTIYFGNKPLSKLFLGIREIVKAYKGSDLVYTNSTPPSTGEIQLINGGKGLKITTDFQLPDGSYPRNEITIPNVCSSCSFIDYESWSTDNWQFEPGIYHRDIDVSAGTIEYVPLDQTPISFPITVGNNTWTTTTSNSDDIEGLQRMASGIRDLTPTPYKPMSSLLNKQDFVGAIRISNLNTNTWYGLDTILDSLVYDFQTTNNWVQTDVPFTVAVFDSNGTKIDINCTSGMVYNQDGTYHSSDEYGTRPLFTGTKYYGNSYLQANIKTTFNTGDNTVVYVAVMYKGTKFTGQSTDQCIWHFGEFKVGVNEFPSTKIGVPLYLNVSVDDDMGKYIYLSLGKTNYGDAKYTVTIGSNGVAQLNEIN